jgi:RNA binding exosome subunit
MSPKDTAKGSKTKRDKNFAQEIGAITMTENVSNSYYNDESYVSCKSADLDKAYKALLKYNVIGQEELNSKIAKTADNGDPFEFNGLEVLKMTLAGDFGNQYSKTSSYPLYYQACLHCWKAMVAQLGKKETIKIWSRKEDESKGGRESYQKSQEAYQKNHLATRSLADMVAGVIRWDDFEAGRKDDLKIAKNLCSRLMSIKGFSKSIEGFNHDIFDRAYKNAETEEEKEAVKQNVTNTATMVLYEQFDKIQAISDYYFRKAALSATLRGQSGDKFFDDIMKTIPTPKSKLIDNTKEEGINI